jgi:hypothetical protein
MGYQHGTPDLLMAVAQHHHPAQLQEIHFQILFCLFFESACMAKAIDAQSGLSSVVQLHPKNAIFLSCYP